MSYRVCIPTAGTGSRLKSLTKYINKSLVSIADRPVLSHLVEKFPADTEFVIALGHQGHLVREFVVLAYPNRHFLFCDVQPFEGPGSGLGLSLLTCKEHLQQPFIFISCDTLVEENVPAPDMNWMGYADTGDTRPYRTLVIEGQQISRVCEKGELTGGLQKPYIGLAGIHDYRQFWEAMESGDAAALAAGESHGLRALLPAKIQAIGFTWHDTGNLDSLTQARRRHHEPGAPTILEKANEAIWFVDDHVIKFCSDPKFIADRVTRGHELIGFVPAVDATQKHMYRYPKVTGRVLPEVISLPLFSRLLEHSQNFWKLQVLGPVAATEFRNACRLFYREKTLDRVALFYSLFSKNDGCESINSVPMPTLATLLNAVDWDWLADGLPGRFHGDFHFENILWNAKEQRFTFLDWRQDFGGNLSTGDIYYDFAKLLHGLIVNHQLVARDLYTVEWSSTDITLDFHRLQVLVQCEQIFRQWLAAQGHDVRKVAVLTALIYLNIAALHHHPYALMLFALGKSMLAQELKEPSP